VSRGEISVGDLTSLLMYTAYLGGGMVSLTSFFASLMKGLGAGARVFELIDRPATVELGKGETLQLDTAVRGKVRFEDVHFTYPSRPQQPILRGVTLDIEPGQSYALVGGSGAGKSSVHSLLLRFYDPTQGRILLAGKDLASYRPESVRKHLAFVPQEPILFDGTLEDNIKYGTDSATREEVAEAARLAGCEAFIADMPRGLDTVIGARQLSGGQRQRIAIARALVRKPAILLLDEATSALDSASELMVNRAIERIIAEGKITVWIVAHRLSTIRSANNIQVL
jgi:ABC-type multidrug transport system fused ATPase/permease subunit